MTKDCEVRETIEAPNGAAAVVSTMVERGFEFKVGALGQKAKFDVDIRVRVVGEQDVADQAETVVPVLGTDWKDRAYASLSRTIELFENQSGRRRPTELLLHPDILGIIQCHYTVVEGVPLSHRSPKMFTPDAVVVNLAADEFRSEKMAVYRLDVLRELAKALWAYGENGK